MVSVCGRTVEIMADVTDRASPRVGIDFGTTNSSVGLLRDGGVELVRFEDGSLSSRSMLYLQKTGSAARSKVTVWTGAAAVAHYLATDQFDDAVQGRLVQSLKSYLAARDLSGTEIFGRQYRFEDLLSRMLKDLRQAASAQFGFEVTRAVVGRPVNFVGADTEADNDFAVERLRGALVEAGFTDIDFALEPVAAAAAYARGVARDETVLIGDFGGGTTDFSLLKVGADGMQKVLASTGVGLAGDSFDARVVRRLVSPALGSESMAKSLDKKLPALPAWVYARLERWHTLSFLRTHSVRELLRTTEMRALEPEKIKALRSLVENDLGYHLHRAVQRLKVELSSRDEANFHFDGDAFTLDETVHREEFEAWIEPDLHRMETAVDAVLQEAGVSASSVNRVFLTGGTSLVPAVRRIFTSRFGEESVTTGEAFTSVAYGLALLAARQD